jgi:hypothetical protein
VIPQLDKKIRWLAAFGWLRYGDAIAAQRDKDAEYEFTGLQAHPVTTSGV